MRQNWPFFHSTSENGPEDTPSVAGYLPMSSALMSS